MKRHDDIRIGTLVRGDNHPAEYIRQIIGHGFESFELTFWESLGNVNLGQVAEQVMRVLEESDTGATISALAVYGNPLAREEAENTWRLLIENASLFGCDLVCGFAGRIPDKPVPESMPRFKQVFGSLAERARDLGVRIGFENCDMGGDWKGGDWNIAFSPHAWELMFNEVPADNLGLEWEPCHQLVSLVDPLPQLRKWIDRVVHVHGKDATVFRDVIRDFGIRGGKTYVHHRTPGFGDTNWADLISILRMGGFTGSIDIEGWHDPIYRDDMEMTGQVRALNYLKQCRGGDYVVNPS